MSFLCNSDTTHLGQWIGFYVDGGDDPGFVLQCINDFAPTRLQLHHLYMPLPVQCFTIGNYSRCLREWENPMEEMLGFFHEVKLIYTTRGPKKDGDREEINFFYGKQAPLVGTRTDGHCFLNHTTKLGRNSSINTNPGYTRSAVKWQGYISWATTFFFSGPRSGTHSGPVKKPPSRGPFGKKLWRLMNGEPALRRPLLPNNTHFACRTLANQSSTKFGTAFKPKGHEDGQRSSCMSFVWLELATMIASIGINLSLGKGYLESL